MGLPETTAMQAETETNVPFDDQPDSPDDTEDQSNVDASIAVQSPMTSIAMNISCSEIPAICPDMKIEIKEEICTSSKNFENFSLASTSESESALTGNCNSCDTVMEMRFKNRDPCETIIPFIGPAEMVMPRLPPS